MRISQINKNAKKALMETNNTRNDHVKNLSFKQGFKDAKHANDKEFMEGKLKEINETGERLKTNGSLKDVVEYKGKIKDFLNNAVKLSLEYQEEGHWESMGHHKLLGIIKTIDQQLAALTEETLKEQRDNLNILSLIDKIQGLLIDVYV